MGGVVAFPAAAAAAAVAQAYDAGLLDEIVVQIASVTLGGGAPLLPRRIDPPLQLQSAQTYGQNFVELHYRVLPPAPLQTAIGSAS